MDLSTVSVKRSPGMGSRLFGKVSDLLWLEYVLPSLREAPSLTEPVLALFLGFPRERCYFRAFFKLLRQIELTSIFTQLGVEASRNFMDKFL